MKINHIIIIISCIIQTPCASAQWWHSNFDGVLNDEVFSLTTDGNKLYAGASANIVRSTDNGVTWTSLDSGVLIASSDYNSQNQVISIAVQGANIYAISETDYGGIMTLWHSSDSGASWVQLYPNFLNSSTSLATMGSTLFAGTEYGIFRSFDSAKSWEEVDTLPTGSLSYPALCVVGTQIFVGYNGGLFLSTNQGKTWHQVQTGMVWPIMIVSSGANMAALNYDPTGSSDSYHHVFYSLDSGSSWNPTSSDSAGSVADLTNIAISGSTTFVGDPAAPGHDFYSNDWGASWHDLCEFGPGSDPDRGTALVVSGPNLVLTSSVTGIYYYQLGNIVDAVIEPVQPIKAISLSPNPTPGAVTIRGMNGTIIITNVLGQTVLTSTAQPDESLTLDLTNEPAGIYFVRAGTQSAKIVVSR